SWSCPSSRPVRPLPSTTELWELTASVRLTFEGSLTFLVSANILLTPQGGVDGLKVIYESRARKSPEGAKCRFLGLFRPFEAFIHSLERVVRVPTPELLPTFATAVNTWQCDENDHLNVQFYTEFAHEASAFLLHRLGLGPAVQR